MLLAAVLVLNPVLAEDGDLRLVATGVEGHKVTWTLDGEAVAVTGDREAAVVAATAGAHEVRATSLAQGRWHAVARIDGVAEGAAYVPAWSATHEPDRLTAVQRMPAGGRGLMPPVTVSLALAAAALLMLPGRRGLEAVRRRRRA